MMKTNKFFTLFLAVFTLFITSCKNDDATTDNGTTTPDSELADYTVILYGTGGGNLDGFLTDNLCSADKAIQSEKVNFTALVKWSKHLQINESYEGLDGVRLIERVQEGVKCDPIQLPAFDPAFPGEEQKYIPQTLNTFTNEQYSADTQFAMYDPANLAKFIDESVEKYPAKNYILILWNHGSDLGQHDAPKNRGCLSDDNLEPEEMMSVYEVQEGIEKSKLGGGKLDLIYTDACLMGNFETIYQWRNSTKYMVAAANLTPGEGGNYEFLLDRLATEDDLVSAMRLYVKLMPQFWRTEGRLGSEDLALYEMNKMEYIIEPFKEVTERFFELYDALSDEDKAKLDELRAVNNPRHNVIVEDQDRVSELLEAADLNFENGRFYYYDLSFDEETKVESVAHWVAEFQDAHVTDLTASFHEINKHIFDMDYELGQAIWDLTYTVKNATIETAENISYPINELAMENMQCLNFSWHTQESYTEKVAAGYTISDFDKATQWSTHFHKFKSPYTTEKIMYLVQLEQGGVVGDNGDDDNEEEEE